MDLEDPGRRTEAGLSVLFVVSGTLLWLGERNTDLRLPVTIALHDAATAAGGARRRSRPEGDSTPGSLEAIRRGTVTARHAAEHHEKWRATPAVTAGGRRHAAVEIAAAGVVLAAGVAAVVLLV